MRVSIRVTCNVRLGAHGGLTHRTSRTDLETICGDSREVSPWVIGAADSKTRPVPAACDVAAPHRTEYIYSHHCREYILVHCMYGTI